MKLDPTKRQAFIKLFQEFVSTYPYTPEGLGNLKAYDGSKRQQKRRQFEAIATEFQLEIFFQLFPDLDLYINDDCIQIHISIAARELNKIALQSDTKAIVEKVGKEIVEFLISCHRHPTNLATACHKLAQNSYLKDLQTSTLVPILNALQPERFLLLDNKTLKVINYFTNKEYKENIADYARANDTAGKLIKELAPDMHQPGVPALRHEDLFHMFAHWLVALKQYKFKEYTLEQCVSETNIEETQLKYWLRAIERKKQIILSGAPGTGKTFIAEHLAKLLTNGDGFYQLLQFHPAYAYEDFIQGIRPQTTSEGQLSYPIVAGRFLEFCQKAASSRDTCVLILDEINRANLGQVFGELMYLLEYRDRSISLAGCNQPFAIPQNVRIIGTMNSSDRSVALVDYALRRRFAFIEISPNYEILRRYHRQHTGLQVDSLIETLQNLNNIIGDRHYYIGISFFLTPNLARDIEDIWRMEIEPYLEVYFFDMPDKVEQFRWGKVKLLN